MKRFRKRLETVTVEVLKILEQEGPLSLSHLSKKLKLSKSYLSKLLKDLTIKGLIEASPYKNGAPRYYKISSKGRNWLKLYTVSYFSVGTSEGNAGFNVFGVFSEGFGQFENLRVKFRVLGFRGGWREFVGMGRVTGLRNVDQVVLDGPGCKVFVNFGRDPSVVIVFSRVEFRSDRFLSEAFAWYRQRVNQVVSWLMRNGIIVDLSSEEVISQEIEFELPDEIDRKVEQQKIRVDLGRKAFSFTGQTKLDAYVELNRSSGKLYYSTNDLIYGEKVVRMPEYIHDLYNKLLPSFTDALDKYNKNIVEHLAAISDIRKFVRILTYLVPTSLIIAVLIGVIL